MEILLGQKVVIYSANVYDSSGNIVPATDCAPPDEIGLFTLYDAFTMTKIKWVSTNLINNNLDWIVHQTDIIGNDLIKSISECDYVVGHAITFNLCVLLCTLKNQKRDDDFIKVKKVFDESRYMICADLISDKLSKHPAVENEVAIINALVQENNTYLNTTNFEFTKTIVKVAIQLNNKNMISKILAQDKMHLIDYKLGLHYATANSNFELCEYFLNQKVVPDVKYLMLMTSYDTDWVSGVTNVYRLYSAYLCNLTDDAYEIFWMTIGLYCPTFERVNWSCVTPECKKWFRVDDKTKYTKDTKYTKLCDMYGINSKPGPGVTLSSIAGFIKKYGFFPTVDQLQIGVKTGISNLIVYLHLEHGYVPDLDTINQIENIYRRLLAYKYFYGKTLDYTAIDIGIASAK